MCLSIALCLALGAWQWQRAGEKESLLADRAAQRAGPELAALGNLTMVRAYQALRLRGQFLNGQSVLLDNRTRAGRAGMEVITPFRDQASGRVVLVNRGWIAFAGDRRRLPVPVPVEGELEIAAEVYGSPRPLLGSLPEALAAAGEVIPVVPYVQADIMGRHFGLDLEPVVLRLREGSAGALRLDWPEQGISPARHRGYALQWFSLAAAFLVLTVYASRVQGRRDRPGAGDTQDKTRDPS